MSKKKTSDKIFPANDAAKTSDGFENFVSKLGTGYGSQNALSAGTYNFDLITRNRLKLEATYRGAWVAGKMVDAVAEDMTRAGIEITTNEQANRIAEFKAAMSRFQIWQSLCSGIKWGRLYGGAIAVIQIKGQRLDTPLDTETISKNQFQGLAVYDRWQVYPDMQSVIMEGPEIGLPMYYNLVTTASTWATSQAQTPVQAAMTGQIKIHHSRCIRFIGIELPFFQAITEMLWGESVLERLWDRLISFDTATMSTANLVNRANLRTVQVDGLRDILAAGGKAQQGLEQMFVMMRELQVNEGLTLLDKNDIFSSTSYTFAGLSDVLLQFAQQLSGATDIPLVRLFGQSPAGLSSTGDGEIRLYYDGVNAQQEAKLRNPIEMVVKVMWRSLFGESQPDDLQFTFAPLWQMTPTEKATIAKTQAETIIGAYEAGLTSQATAMKELRQNSGATGMFSNITDEDINGASEEEPPLPELEPNTEDPVKNLE